MSATILPRNTSELLEEIGREWSALMHVVGSTHT